MARRQDFAQKLLDDLRLRKERLAVAQGGSRNAHARGDAYANSRQMIRGSTSGKGSMKYSPTQNRAIERQKQPKPSNQIVPFMGGRGTKHMQDLSMALAFAMENGGKLRMTDSSRNQNPMLSFLREMGRGTMNGSGRSSATVQVLHVKEISKGAEKLNRILRAWSSGLNFEQCSVEIGKELLKGAIDLQESLRMLANLQGTSLEFSTGPRQRNRIVLLEDDEDDDASIIRSNGGNKIKPIEPPRFSFDKQLRRDRGNQKLITAVMNTGLPALTYPNESSKFSISISNPVKERKNNVIAKLMGLEELPANDAAAYNFHEVTTGFATLKPDGPPWSISPSIQDEQANKSPLSQEISRMMMGSDRKVIVEPDTRAAEVESIKRLYLKKSEKSDSARSYPKADDGRLKEQRTIDKPIRTDKNQKHEQGMTRNPDRKGPKDRKSTGTIKMASRPHGKQETGQKLRGKGRNNEGKPQVDDKKGSTLQDNSQRKRGDAKHRDEKGSENLVTAEFADMVRTKEYKSMKIERIPAQGGGAQSGRERERKEIPEPVLREAKVTEYLETKKYQVMKEAAKKKGGLGEGLLRPLPRSSHYLGLQMIKQEKILDVSESITPLPQRDGHRSAELKQEKILDVSESITALPQRDGHRSAESISTVHEEAEHRTSGTNNENTRYQELSTVVANPVSDRKDPVMSPLHITVARSQECTFQTYYREFGSTKLNFDQHTDENSLDQEIHRAQIPETLTESENRLKKVLLGSQLFIDTAETFFNLNIPSQTILSHEHVLTKDDSGLILDCGYEIAKRKGRLQELAVHPLMKTPAGFLKVETLDDLIKQLSGSFERLKSHGRDGNPSCEAEEYVPRMFEADMDTRDPETNCMWDLGWNCVEFAFVERDEVVRNIEKMVIGGLIDEIARDLVQAA